jgi:hypothetical protein
MIQRNHLFLLLRTPAQSARVSPPRQGEWNSGDVRRAVFFQVLGALIIAFITTVSLATLVPAQGAEIAFELKVEKGRVAQAMRLIRVTQGDAVKLRWTSDRPIILHLHGYDIETEVTPGAVAEMVFTARATGRFPIEEHKPDTRGGHSHSEAPLVRIEVRPR